MLDFRIASRVTDHQPSLTTQHPVQAEKELSILEKIGVRLSSILSSFNKKSEISKKTVNSINEQSNLTSQLLSSQKQVTSSKQSELNVSNKVNETINKSTENVKEKSKLVSDRETVPRGKGEKNPGRGVK